MDDLQEAKQAIDKKIGELAKELGQPEGLSPEDLAKAQEAAEKARRWGDVVEMAPMNAYDRRIVHQALKEEGVTTESIEVDGTSDKAVIIRPSS